VVDPFDLNYKRASTEDLEEFMLFCIAVAAKNAVTTAKILERFLVNWRHEGYGPFEAVRWFSQPALAIRLRQLGMGCHEMKSKTWLEIAHSDINLRRTTTEELERIHGIGPKTSRFFILHTQKNAQVAVLDTHILKFLRERGYDAPLATPSGRRYAELEQVFLKECRKRRVSPKEFDLKIWSKYAVSKREKLDVVGAYN
jgi:thermostable 8-oxoguanine DNA glycosylase